MAEDFDPYFIWLGIPPEEQPPNHYRLLGVPLFVANADVIAHAADRQMAHLRTFQTGKNSQASQKLLNEISAARLCLLNVQRKADYDAQLRAKLAPTAQPQPRPPAPVPITPQVARPVVVAPAAPANPLADLEFAPSTREPRSRKKRPPTSTTPLGVKAALGLGAIVVATILIGIILTRGRGSKATVATNDRPPAAKTRDERPASSPASSTSGNSAAPRNSTPASSPDSFPLPAKSPAAPPHRPDAVTTSPAPVLSSTTASAGAPAAAIAPFDAQQAASYQAAWAKHLGTKVVTTNSQDMQMVLIPPGEFSMGSTDEQITAAVAEAQEIDADQSVFGRIPKAERPQHRVIITRPFLIGATEVTIGQFKKFSATGYLTEAEKATAPGETYFNPGYAVTDDSPAALITWNDALAYCRWLSSQEKTVYRLPTEAEWEYACRAGATTQYSFGDDHNNLESSAWYRKNAEGTSHQVGTKSPNAFGLFDMHGSVYEWCGDFWDEKWYETPSLHDQGGPASGPNRVIRGGSWKHVASYCRSAYRAYSTPSNRDSGYGFRVVRVVEVPSVAGSDTLPAKPPAPGPTSTTVSNRAPALAIAPFDAQQAANYQATWAKHLGTKIVTNNSLGMPMVLIPPGEFSMGSTDDQVSAALDLAKSDQGVRRCIEENERPQHRVRISKPFLMSAKEVTLGEFKQFIAATNYKTDAEKFPEQNKHPAKPGQTYLDPGYAVNDESPVSMVTWNDAVQFCSWLSEQEKLGRPYHDSTDQSPMLTGKGYHLPTDAQWEYACRAGTTSLYSHGDDVQRLGEYAWPYESGIHDTAQKLPNPFQLFDMHGNVNEWCHDWHEAAWYEHSPPVDPIGPESGADRAVRGGSSKDNNHSTFRSGYRSNTPPSSRYGNFGFRCVREW